MRGYFLIWTLFGVWGYLVSVNTQAPNQTTSDQGPTTPQPPPTLASESTSQSTLQTTTSPGPITTSPERPPTSLTSSTDVTLSTFDDDNCPCPNTEYVDCVNSCNTCEQRNLSCTTSACNPGCDCIEGFFRNSLGECVPENECDCPINESLESCPKPYPSESCDAIGINIVCNILSQDDCHPECRCRKNFKRNCDGKCIDIRECAIIVYSPLSNGITLPVSRCTPHNQESTTIVHAPLMMRGNLETEPLKCKKNEEYDPCPNNPTCINQRCGQTPQRTCLTVWDGICYPQCLCKRGYCKDQRGNCVEESCNGDPNAEFNRCGDPCPRSCARPEGPIRCPRICLPPGCRCKSGFVRDYKGKCIKLSKCPVCDKPNEEFRCGSPCDAFCSSLNETCPLANKTCIPRCYCKPGFARDENNTCIPIAQCPQRPRCRRNELFDICSGHEECCVDNMQGVKNFAMPEICVPRCRCVPGYVRKDNGNCVLPAQCCSDPNEEVVSCKHNCPSGTCRKPKLISCDRECEVYPQGCQCKRGYVRASKTDRKCILQTSCPKKRNKTKKNDGEDEDHDEHM